MRTLLANPCYLGDEQVLGKIRRQTLWTRMTKAEIPPTDGK